MGVPPVILFHAQGEDTMSGVRIGSLRLQNKECVALIGT
jgi:hypothetical protein